ncbi:hypothetical protein M8C21_020572, partial [Ambrosia artemisiifolia]
TDHTIYRNDSHLYLFSHLSNIRSSYLVHLDLHHHQRQPSAFDLLPPPPPEPPPVLLPPRLPLSPYQLREMAGTPMLPANLAAGGANMDGNAAAAPPTPGTDMTGICFRDQMRSIHPLDISHLSKMTGIEFMVSEVMEPHLFVMRKQKRDGPEKVTPMLTYYVLDGSIYQAPQLCNVFAARVGRALYYISKAFTTAASKLEKVGYVDSEDDSTSHEPKATKETIDFKEVKRVDHILASLQRKLPAAPPPPPFPEGYTPPTAEGEQGPEAEQADPSVDPILDQGPAKRIKYA